MEQKLWYAIQVGADDNDWRFGTYSEGGAYELAEEHAKMYPKKMIRIAVIEVGPDPICIEERIIQEGE